MDSKFNQFLLENNNKSIEVSDTSALYQCMDLIQKYVDFLNIPLETVRRPYAYQVWTLASDLTKKYFNLVLNTANYIPPVGAIAVFGRDGDKVVSGIIRGIPVGHVSIVAPGTNVMDLISFDQNWDTQHYYHYDGRGNKIPYSRLVVHRKYDGVIGFLVLKPEYIKGSAIPDDVFVNKVKAIVDSATLSPMEKRQRITDLTK